MLICYGCTHPMNERRWFVWVRHENKPYRYESRRTMLVNGGGYALEPRPVMESNVGRVLPCACGPWRAMLARLWAVLCVGEDCILAGSETAVKQDTSKAYTPAYHETTQGVVCLSWLCQLAQIPEHRSSTERRVVNPAMRCSRLDESRDSVRLPR